jgi:hypothetical protein
MRTPWSLVPVPVSRSSCQITRIGHHGTLTEPWGLQTPPALLHRDPNPVSAVVCVDLDYAFVARPVSRARGVLAVPADDWKEIVTMHHRPAVWSAVMAGVPLELDQIHARVTTGSSQIPG